MSQPFPAGLLAEGRSRSRPADADAQGLDRQYLLPEKFFCRIAKVYKVIGCARKNLYKQILIFPLLIPFFSPLSMITPGEETRRQP